MGLVRNVTKNALSIGTVQLLAQISTFILSIYLARYLGTENYGAYTLAFSLTSLVFLIADFNLNFQMVVNVAPNKGQAPQYLANTLFLRAVLGIVALVVTLAIVMVEEQPTAVSYAIMIIALATAFNWLNQSFNAMYTSFERMHLTLLTSSIERIFTVTVAIVMVVVGFGLDTVAMVVLAGSLLQFVLGYVVCSRLVVRPARRPIIGQAVRQLREAVPYSVMNVFIVSLYSVNAVLVQLIILWMGGTHSAAYTATGMFNVSFNMVTALIAIPNVLITSLLPVVSRMYKNSVDATQLMQQKVMKFMFTLGLPIAVGGVILADQIVLLFYGPAYAQSATVFRILIPAVAISFFDSGMGSVLASAKRVHLITVANGVGALFNLAFCFAFIPFFYQDGAALAFTLAYLVLVSLTFYFLRTRVFRINVTEILFKPLLAVGGMGVALLLVSSMNLFVAIAIGVAVYFGLIFLLQAINQEDKEILMKIMKKS
ncbi:MAG: flippase [Methanomassiliicoccus sp.]|nr:flippase [Methanomassiliicoccus sp.]